LMMELTITREQVRGSTSSSTAPASSASAGTPYRFTLPLIIPDNPEEHGGFIKRLRKKDCNSDDEFRVREGMWIPETKGGGVAWATDSDMCSYKVYWISTVREWGGSNIDSKTNFPVIALQFGVDDEAEDWDDMLVFEVGKSYKPKKPYWLFERCMTVTLNTGVGPLPDVIQLYKDIPSEDYVPSSEIPSGDSDSD